VKHYTEWTETATADNFATWMKKRGRKKPDASKQAADAPSEAVQEVNVLNAKLMGQGLRLVYEAVQRALSTGDDASAPAPFVLTVGGDHSVAASSIAALQERHANLGVIWIDAHADANTPRSSPSGHYHGMPAAHLLGWFDKPGEMGTDGASGGTHAIPGFEWFPSGCLAESRLAYIGLRDVDPEEARMLRASGVRVFTMRDVDKHGISRVIEMAIEAVGPSMDCPLHLSLDIDSIDPHYAPGTGTAARGGLTYREIHYICEECALTRRLVSMDLVEVNPGLDPPPAKPESEEDDHHSSGGAMHGDNPAIRRASPTVRLAVELVLSALGKQVC